MLSELLTPLQPLPSAGISTSGLHRPSRSQSTEQRPSAMVWVPQNHQQSRGTTSSDSTARQVWDNFTSESRVQAFCTGTKKELFFLKNRFLYSCYFILSTISLKKNTQLLPKAITCGTFMSQCTSFFLCGHSSDGGQLCPSAPRLPSGAKVWSGSPCSTASGFHGVPLLLERVTAPLLCWV